MIRALTIFALLVLASQIFAQVQLSTKNKKALQYYIEADNYRVRGQSQQAIDLLHAAIDKDKNFFEAYYRLGLVYIGKSNYNEAVKSLEAGLGLTQDVSKQKIFWYDLGDCYFHEGEYQKAFKSFSDFLKAEEQNKPKIDHAKQMLKNIEFVQQQTSPSAYKLHALSDTVNCFAMQYFPALTADQQELIFTCRRGNDPNDDEDLVISYKDRRGRWTTPVSVSKNINTKLNEGTCTISADGRKLIFTSCVGREGHGSCDLYESVKIGEEWSEPKNLGVNVNSSEWESQPSLSADGRTLYFVSDRRGGFGRRDIWVASQNDKGQWTRAKNAGKQINTEYDEISPFIHVNNKTLYFASKGLTGFGGYDIYFTEKDSTDTWNKPVNIGAPINNQEDQFSLFITADGKKGYYSHEAVTPSGSSTKIFEIEIPESNQVRYKSNYVKGIIRDKETKQPLQASVELINLEKDATESFVTSDSLTGEYLIVLTQGAEYALYVDKKEYLFQSLNFNYSTVKDFKPITLNVELEKAKKGSTVILNNIFFDVDKFELKEKSKTELSTIVNFLNKNPQLKIEIGGHTDNTGSSSYNHQLSEKRAYSVYNYLIDKGIKSSRMLAKGYGPDHPVAPNDSEETRQLNRRIEFKILQ